MGEKIVALNKKAGFDYTVLERLETGISLTGAEVKSAKMGNCSLRDSFCLIAGGELLLKNCLISPYEKGSAFNLDPARDRKLLAHKKEIMRLYGKAQQKGLTLVPLKLYFKGNFLKAEIGLCEGKKLHDKREAKKEKDLKRDLERELKNYK